MPDQRSRLEVALWQAIGPPLYYCQDCLRAVDVHPAESDGEPQILRPCAQDCGHPIIAPRKAVCTGQGGLDLPPLKRAELRMRQIASGLTGRSV